MGRNFIASATDIITNGMRLWMAVRKSAVLNRLERIYEFLRLRRIRRWRRKFLDDGTDALPAFLPHKIGPRMDLSPRCGLLKPGCRVSTAGALSRFGPIARSWQGRTADYRPIEIDTLRWFQHYYNAVARRAHLVPSPRGLSGTDSGPEASSSPETLRACPRVGQDLCIGQEQVELRQKSYRHVRHVHRQ